MNNPWLPRRRMQEAQDRREREAEIATCDTCEESVRKHQDGRWTDCRCIREARDAPQEKASR